MPWEWKSDEEGFQTKVKKWRQPRRMSPDMAMLASELRDHLLWGGGNGNGWHGKRRPEWACSCGWHNFMDRQCCRKCGKEAPAKPLGGQAAGPAGAAPALPPASGTGVPATATEPSIAATPAVPRPAPWKVDKVAELRRRVAATEAALAAAVSEGGDSELEALLRTQLDGHRAGLAEQERKPAKPLVEQLAGCRAYLERARKRATAKAEEIQAAEATVRTLSAELEALRADIAEHEAHMQEIEKEALTAQRVTPAPLAATTAPDAKLLEQVAALTALVSKAAPADSGVAEDILKLQVLSARLHDRLSAEPDAAMADGTPTQAVGTEEAETVPASFPAVGAADDAIAEARVASTSAGGRVRPAPY